MTTSNADSMADVARTGPSLGAAPRAVTALAAQQVRRGAAVVALLSAGMSALVAVQYRATFAGTLDVASLEALAANPAISTLFGPARALDELRPPR